MPDRSGPSARFSRRDFFRAAAAGAAAAGAGSLAAVGCRARTDEARAAATGAACGDGCEPFFVVRGVVLVPDDLTLEDWPKRARAAGLTTIGLHHGLRPSIVTDFVRCERGRRFLEECRRLGLDVEYELHAMGELLPRELFERDPDLFRMDEKGARAPDSNLCVHSERALEIVAGNALRIDEELRPTTHRRFLWGDDGAPWCRCRECAPLSDSDQALIVENRILAALRRLDPDAELAHLAYANTLVPPRSVRPDPGIFLEFAPLAMRFERPLTPLSAPANAEVLAQLDANLSLLPPEHAQALEYWLDDSMYSNWRKPARPLRWSDEVFASDLETYASRGVRRVTSFAVYLDADYVRRFGFPEAVSRYGAALAARRT